MTAWPSWVLGSTRAMKWGSKLALILMGRPVAPLVMPEKKTNFFASLAVKTVERL